MSKVSPRADFVASLAWIAFGVAIVAGSIAMDRMERFGAKLHTAPGLVPGVLGTAIAVLGIALLVRSLRAGAVAGLAQSWRQGTEGRTMRVRAGLAMALTLVYTLLLVGRGLPFWFATLAFVFVFLLVFDLPERRAKGTMRRGLLIAALVAIATSTIVTLLFERVFLVRMP